LSDRRPTAPTTICATQEMIDEIATSRERSRNGIVSQALEHDLDANAWQIERIKKGVAAARKGQVRPAKEVFVGIATKHGWAR